MLDYTSLSALSAVCQEGSFEKASQRLNLTQSAVSQKIKLLESRLGAILVVRGKPCKPTAFGQLLIRHVESVRVLERDFLQFFPTDGLAQPNEPVTLRIAVNADSIATWFPAVIANFTQEHDALFDLVQDDQNHTANRLKEGDVFAAVTSDSRPVQGFRRTPLGTLEYMCVASPKFRDRYFKEGVTFESISKAPGLRFNRKDTLPEQWVSEVFDKDMLSNTHWVPSYEGYYSSCLTGVGWGLHPTISTKDAIERGDLVELIEGSTMHVPLFWLHSTKAGELIRSLTHHITEVSSEFLSEAK